MSVLASWMAVIATAKAAAQAANVIECPIAGEDRDSRLLPVAVQWQARPKVASEATDARKP